MITYPAVQAYLDSPQQPKMIEFGSGPNIKKGWLSTDYNGGGGVVALDVTEPFPIPDASFDYAFSEHMIEHVPFEGGRHMMREIHRILKPGGVVRIVTPSIDFLMSLFMDAMGSEEYVEWATAMFIPTAPKPMTSIVFNNFVRAWGHQFIYDGPTLRFVIKDAGFEHLRWERIGESPNEALRNLECVQRLPPGFLERESQILEGTKI